MTRKIMHKISITSLSPMNVDVVVLRKKEAYKTLIKTMKGENQLRFANSTTSEREKTYWKALKQAWEPFEKHSRGYFP